MILAPWDLKSFPSLIVAVSVGCTAVSTCSALYDALGYLPVQCEIKSRSSILSERSSIVLWYEEEKMGWMRNGSRGHIYMALNGFTTAEQHDGDGWKAICHCLVLATL